MAWSRRRCRVVLAISAPGLSPLRSLGRRRRPPSWLPRLRSPLRNELYRVYPSFLPRFPIDFLLPISTEGMSQKHEMEMLMSQVGRRRGLSSLQPSPDLNHKLHEANLVFGLQNICASPIRWQARCSGVEFSLCLPAGPLQRRPAPIDARRLISWPALWHGLGAPTMSQEEASQVDLHYGT